MCVPPDSVLLQRCRHGSYHLTVSGVTLHLTPLELHGIQQTLTRLLAQHGKQFEQDVKEQNAGQQAPLPIRQSLN